jgi:GNAT superfamily N-acetyltransferase
LKQNWRKEGRKIIQEERLEISYTSRLDKETGVIQYSAKIMDTDFDILLGTASFTQYNLALYENWTELMEVANYYSEEERQLIEALQSLLEEQWINGKGILLHSLVIKDAFQGKGIGKIAMVKMLSYWTVLGADFVILRASPLNKKHLDIPQGKTIERLVYFYESLGFEKMDIEQNELEPMMISYLQ